MTVCDFGRSYATFTSPGRANNARIQAEAICDLMTEGEVRRYVLVASCKAEDTYGEGDLFRLPNYDFSAIFSKAEHQIIRVHLPVQEDGLLETGLNRERFEGLSIDLVEAPARPLEDDRAVVQATLDNLPIVARTELLGEGGELLARLEYPVKTMNANDLRWMFQVDTGPLIVPDFSREVAQEIERFDVAFVVYKCFDRAEFILQRPTPVGGALAGHYSEVRKLRARNELFALE